MQKFNSTALQDLIAYYSTYFRFNFPFITSCAILYYATTILYDVAVILNM